MEASNVRECFYEDLNFDEACVNLRTDENSNSWLYALSTDCVLCPYTRIAPIATGLNSSIKVSTVRAVKWRVLNTLNAEEYVSAKNTSNMICELSPSLGQFGVYELSIENQNCIVRTLKESTYPYTELFLIFGALILVLLAVSGVRSLWHVFRKHCMKSSSEVPANEPTKRRVKAIDTFRGASIVLMIFVNNGAGGYPILGHATWNGLLIGDLVFPCFLWIMGVCVPIALSSQLKRMVPKYVITLSIIKRSVMLFLIGLSLNTVSGSGSPQLETLRIFGVLQRFGISYFIVSLTYIFLMPHKPKKTQTPCLREFQDLWTLLPQSCVMILIVIGHCALTFCLDVPGCPNGYLGPGGRHDDGKYFDCAGGATGYIDRWILNQSHLYQRPLIHSVYGSGPFDPEGILGCLTTVFQVFLGVQAGVVMMSYKDWRDRVIRWLLWAAFFGCLGCALHFTSVIPVNKNLWSLSFVFVTTSFALAFFSGCYLLVDVLKLWRGGPFRIPGMNALTLYVGHILCTKMFPFHWRIGSMESRALGLIESVWCIALWTLVAYIMHRKRTYVTL